MESEPIIQLKNIFAGYNDQEVLHDVSLTIYDKDFLGIIGPNGGGKTTLIKLMLGLLRPERGEVKHYRDGQEVKDLKTGYLPQYNTFDKKFPISVRDVILSGLHSNHRVFHCFRKADKNLTSQILEMLDLTNYAERAIGELSGGQRQRVLIGRALICQPEVLVLDEPSTYIDQSNQEKLYELLNRINENCAIILVSHDIGTVLRNVRNIACVNGQVHYHPASEVDEKTLEKSFGCPFQLVAHGHVPHRVLEEHED
jgi:zinc transport system ATP-binding protein